MSKERNNYRTRRVGPHCTREKAKDFKLAIKKLIISLKKFWSAIIVSLILAGLASILTIMAPNKLSLLTDELTNVLVPKQEVIEDITLEITENLSEENISNILMELLSIDIEEVQIKLKANNISSNIKKEINEFLKNGNNENYLINLNNLSNEAKNVIFNDSNYKGIKVSVKEKTELLNVINNKDNIDFSLIPSSIQKIFLPESKYNNITLTTEDKVTFLSILNEISNTKNQGEIFSLIDKLPSNIYELVKPEIDFTIVKHLVLIIALLYGFNAIFSYIEGLLMVNVSNNYARNLRNKLSKKINKLPLKYFDKNTIGDTLSRITNDVDIVSQSMNQSFGTLISALAMFIGSIIMMFYTNYIMAITAILSSFIGFVFMFKFLSKSQKYFTARQVELGNINGHIEEVFSGHNVINLYNGKREVNKIFDELNEKVYNCERKSQFLSGLMQPLMAFVGNFGYVAVCIVGALLTFNGNISFGVIVAFMLYVRLFTNPLTQLAQAMTNLQTTAAASERIFEFLEESEMINESNKTKVLLPNKVKGNITFNHVKFGYDDEIIIKDFSASVKAGQKIAIVGPTGAGKTTLVNLLMNFYEINSGDITIDGVSIKELTRENIHDLFIMVLQDTWLFNGNIRDNIKYNKKNISDDDIWKVCDVVGVSHYIKTLPNGLDSEITDASAISSGQKQLLTIARGMIKNAPFLILDEATSNVDTRTEELVQKAMDKLTEKRTSFIIAHRLSTIKNADLILVMDNGNIIETGSHDELMNQNGFYAKLYNSQFDKITE